MSLCKEVHSPRSFIQSPPLLPAPINFLLLAPFSPFVHSFFIFLCSLLLFNFSSCSRIFSCYMLLFRFLLFFRFLDCSLLQDYHLSALCSFTYFMACSLLLCLKYCLLAAAWLPLTGVFKQSCLFQSWHPDFQIILSCKHVHQGQIYCHIPASMGHLSTAAWRHVEGLKWSSNNR